jgi:nucleotide-binding universal stress UspA family protein
VRSIPWSGREAADEIDAAVSDYGADLLVVGGYGHARMHQLIFGGCTQRFLDRADGPILLMRRSAVPADTLPAFRRRVEEHPIA